MCALLETLISHPRAEAASQAAAAPNDQQESTIADAVQALSLQQTPPATPGECPFPATTALRAPCAHPHAHQHGYMGTTSLARGQRALSWPPRETARAMMTDSAISRDNFHERVVYSYCSGRGNAWDELQTEAKAVAAQQRTAELTEWLGCAKIALQVWHWLASRHLHRPDVVLQLWVTACSHAQAAQWQRTLDAHSCETAAKSRSISICM